MSLESRARRHAALGDPVRLAIADDLAVSDRSPGELARRHGLSSNLLAHHLDVLEAAGLVVRTTSSGDGRRRYVRLLHDRLAGLTVGGGLAEGPVLFVCTHNSARSQLAAALWVRERGGVASSAGTHPATEVHPGAMAAAARAGLDLTGNRPRRLDEVEESPVQVVTVCDRAHEELSPDGAWWHWSIPDPLDEPTEASFDRALSRIASRIELIGAEESR